jgi:3',5'-cyclic AMP phosphodiesterase CpdA
MARHLILPDHGRLMVSTDLHGNGDDFRRLREIFLSHVDRDPDVHWAILGDLVHGPSAHARREQPELHDYEDESAAIVGGVRELLERFPHRVHLLLGNHDHGHVGGAHTSRFFRDEVSHLESRLDARQLAALRELFEGALLVAAAPCGVLLAHGSPSDLLADLQRLDSIALRADQNGPADRRLLATILESYGQPGAVTGRMLRQVGARHGLDLGVVIHGHDRDDEGWFADADNQLCPVLFGAPRASRRYVELDLAARYRSVADIRDGVELLRVHAS